MRSIANFDVVEGRKTRIGTWCVQFAFGIFCAMSGIGFRSLIDIWAPTAGPFALVYPTVLIATLFGRALSGIVAYATSFLWAWWYVLPATKSFQFELVTDPSRVLINAVAVMILLFLAEEFRRAVRAASFERDREIALRKLLNEELEHRTKNNFALVASLLSLQSRRHNDPRLTAALEEAIGRVRIFAEAYDNLSLANTSDGTLPMGDYVRDVVERVVSASLHDGVRTTVEVDDAHLPPQTAVAVGLFLNEALTNCAKYAFGGAREGDLRVRFHYNAHGWSAHVEDDGPGAQGEEQSGLGQNLMRAFAQQAGARFERQSGPSGHIVSLIARPENCEN